MDGSLRVTGGATVSSGGVHVTGESAVRGDTRVTGRLTVDPRADGGGGDAAIVGATHVEGALAVGDHLAVASGAVVVGDSDADGTLAVGGAAAVEGDLTVTGRLQVSGAFEYPNWHGSFGLVEALAPDADVDGDGVVNARDNCVVLDNPDQADDDLDGLGDPCDPAPDGDADEDGISNDEDNCAGTHNPGQEDFDGDGLGDVCDPDQDGDGFFLDTDCEPTDPEIYPDARPDAACDGIDEDCDGVLDEDYPVAACDTGVPGVCAPGTRECVAAEEVCLGPAPGVETCNGLDDDCDGELDEGCPEDGALRLVGGAHPWIGRVEVYHHGVWGTVCDDLWDLNDANVVCRQLGYAGAEAAPCCAPTGQGAGTIWMDNVACSGNEARLADCGRNGWGWHNCGHWEDAGVVCIPPDGTVRLVGGNGPFEGRVEIVHDGRWGTVCDDHWGGSDARVVCRQLGYSVYRWWHYGSHWWGNGTGDIWMDDVSCAGGEARLDQCGHRGWGSHSCTHREDAGVTCR